MTIMLLSIFLVSRLIRLSVALNSSSNCEHRTLLGSNGTIKYQSAAPGDCDWLIQTPEDAITTIRILEFDFNSGKSCLSVKNVDEILLDLCEKPIKKPPIASSRKNIVNIRVNNTGSVILWLEYYSRENSQCKLNDFECFDRSNCFNYGDICATTAYICADHTEYIGCGPCNSTTAICNTNNDHLQCFDPIKQRCDGIIDCPKGEDELNCTELCPRLIKCYNEDKCLTLNQICDSVKDCASGYDEFNCTRDTSIVSSILLIVMFIICSVCCTLFVCLVFRCLFYRRSAAFQNFHEEDTEQDHGGLIETEFMAGGNFYEQYMTAKRTKSRSSKSAQIGETDPQLYLNLNGDDELVVLTSLNVPADMCIGLSDSSKESLKIIESMVVKNSSSRDLSEPTINLKKFTTSAPSTSIETKTPTSFPTRKRLKFPNESKKSKSVTFSQRMKKARRSTAISIDSEDEFIQLPESKVKSYFQIYERQEKENTKRYLNSNDLCLAQTERRIEKSAKFADDFSWNVSGEGAL